MARTKGYKEFERKGTRSSGVSLANVASLLNKKPKPKAPGKYTPALNVSNLVPQETLIQDPYYKIPDLPSPSPWRQSTTTPGGRKLDMNDPNQRIQSYLQMINSAMQPGFTNRNSLVNTSLYSPWNRLFGTDVMPQIFGAMEQEPEPVDGGGGFNRWGGSGWGGGGGYSSTPYKTPRWFQDMIMWRI